MGFFIRTRESSPRTSPHARTPPGRSLLWGFAITKARRPGDNHGVSLSGTLYGKRAWPLTICNYSYFIKAHKMLVWPFGSPLQEKETDLNTPVCAPSSLDRGYPCLSLVGAAHSAKWEFSNPTGKVIYHNWLHNAPKLWYDYRWKGVLLLSSPWKAQCPNWSHAWITPYKRRTSAVRGFYLMNSLPISWPEESHEHSLRKKNNGASFMASSLLSSKAK